MKKSFLFSFVLLICGNVITAQTTKTLKRSVELQMPKEAGDDNAGSNGACVVWHPVQKKYYAAMAGNMNYPLAVFNESGKRLSSNNMTTMIDLRGLWYNPIKKSICGNGYDDNGWFHYVLDPKGAVLDINSDIAEMTQPNSQCVGAFNPDGNEVMFLTGNRIALYSNVGSLNGHIDLHLGLSEKDDIGEEFNPTDEIPDAYNYTSVIYTGIKNAEVGVLNIDKNQIELYDLKTGFLTTILTLPKSQVTYRTFSFSYSNSLYWLYNKTTREWTSYK